MPFFRNQFLLLNLAIQANAVFQQDKIVIDYVKIYNLANQLVWSDEF